MKKVEDLSFDEIGKTLHTAVIGDILDTMGMRNQFLPPYLRSVLSGQTMVGRAMPVLEADCATDWVSHENIEKAFGVMFDALDSLAIDDIYICTGSSHKYALWGELMSTRAKELKAAGAILDGFHRDTNGVLDVGLPVFSRGGYAQDQRVRGRVIDYNCPIEFSNGLRVRPGELIFGDIDGIVVVPKEAEAEVLELAFEKIIAENEVRDLLRAGRSTRSVWDEKGVM